MKQLDKKLFSVAELSKLGAVVPATVRRWRSEGLNGIKLVPYHEEESGCEKPNSFLLFSRETVRDFVQRNPRVMTDELRAALLEEVPVAAEPAQQMSPEDAISKIPFSQIAHATVTFSGRAQYGKSQYYYKLLCARESELQRELDYVRKERAELESDFRKG